jgi:hypothetical protein
VDVPNPRPGCCSVPCDHRRRRMRLTARSLVRCATPAAICWPV